MAGEFDPRLSYGMLWLAHRDPDCQYGFGAVLNDIPLLVMARWDRDPFATVSVTTEDFRSNP